jgi:signal transduction histidine kinase
MMRRPEHARFEYMLDGVDSGWQSAGTRRSAFYTRLGPGQYVFRVRAFNEDGMSSERDATYAFKIAPTWYQTVAFRLACVVFLLALSWWIYTLRLRAVTTRMRIRHDERERIARDLHDTLLQGFQGLILRFQAVRRHVTTDPAKALGMIDDALARADGVMEEGRDKVSSLRAVDGVEADLPAAILAASDELIDQRDVAFELAIHGRPRRLKASVHEEVYRVIREAMINALHHSGGDRVEVTVEYGRRLLEVTVRDNGVGFDASATQERHWGVAGMHERASAVGAQLGIWSRPGSGTEVSLRVDGRRGYL